MRLPASVLGTLRVGLSATALMAGCDAEAPRTLEPVIENMPVAELERAPQPGLGAQVEATLVEAAREARRTRSETTFASVERTRQEVEPDPTAFVPFSENPSEAAPIRPRIRSRPERRAQPKPEPAQFRTWRDEPTPKWDGEDCPACGRG